MDVDSNAFLSRSILIRYQGEEASMRDSCCWRIEVPFEAINDTSLVFYVDLYSHQPIKSDNRVIAYAEKATVDYLHNNNCSLLVHSRLRFRE